MTIKKLPTYLGFMGAVAFVEAKTGDYRDQLEIVEAALAKAVYPGKECPWVNIQSFFADYAVIKKDGRYFSYKFLLNENNEVSFEDPTEVVKNWQPVGVTQLTEAHSTGFIEATGTKNKFLVTIIEAGESKNGKIYPAKVLKNAVPFFEGTPAIVKEDSAHLSRQGRTFNGLIGKYTNVHFVESIGIQKLGALQATLEIFESEPVVLAKLIEAVEKNMTDLFGLSIDADGEAFVHKTGPKRGFIEAKSITEVNSVDLIMKPGAGGRVISFIEAEGAEDMTLQQLIEALAKKNPTLANSINLEDPDKAIVQLVEALSVETGGNTPAVVEGLTKSDITTMLEAHNTQVSNKAAATVAINSSKLPDISKQRLIESLDNQTDLAAGNVTALIEAEVQYVAGFSDEGKTNLPGFAVHYKNVDNGVELLEALFDPADRSVNSIKDVYIECTGDRNVTGYVKNCDKTRMIEALDSSSFPEVLGDSIARQMIKEYMLDDSLSIWKLIADVTRASDFRTQERTRFGGYGDLSTVAESGSYPAMSSPSDESVSYAVAKRGGTETITLEMIVNDDVGAVNRIPKKLARAAKRTLLKFVMDFLRTNPNAYDGKAIFHADHNNLLTAALSDTSWAAARLAMKKQTEPGSNEALGIAPKYLFIPDDLEETAFDMFRRDTNNDETFVQTSKPTVVPVSYWDDANDWVAAADKNDVPIMELAFLHGQEEPELFIQDAPTHGSMFTNDTTTYKIRHIYGGNALDYRGLQKSVVA